MTAQITNTKYVAVFGKDYAAKVFLGLSCTKVMQATLFGFKPTFFPSYS